ncbi:MAG TPA: metallopeptidase family protein [Kofleriaceae bacterium]|nr:metallopeptidase family protein [Kofleriaceae bacterium]
MRWALALLLLAACGDRAVPPAPGSASGAGSPPVASGAPAAKPADPAPTHDGHDHEAPLVGVCDVDMGGDEIDDRRVELLLDQAGKRLDVQEWGDAFTCADMAADLAPRSIEAHHLRAAALAGAGHDEKAGVAYNIALALDPEDPETLRAVADFYINVSKSRSRDTTSLGLELARRGSARATARRRGHGELRARLALLEAQAWNDLDRADEALERAGEAVRLQPDLIDAVHEKGVAMFNLGRFAEARGQFEQVLTALPDDAYAHHLLGLTLEQLGERQGAEDHFVRARALSAEEFPAPVEISEAEMRAEIERVLATLAPERAARVREVVILVTDLPDAADLRAVSPPFPPTILGLFRGLPLGAVAAPGEDVPPRAILLYRLNLARAVRSRSELTQQIERTLLHEIGHLEGLDEDDLRRHDLE